MKEFRFVQAENSGWVVFAITDQDPSMLPPIKGAYSSTEDLLAGFPALLQTEGGGTPEEPVTLQEGDV